jgi:hypothetical protein
LTYEVKSSGKSPFHRFFNVDDTIIKNVKDPYCSLTG